MKRILHLPLCVTHWPLRWTWSALTLALSSIGPAWFWNWSGSLPRTGAGWRMKCRWGWRWWRWGHPKKTSRHDRHRRPATVSAVTSRVYRPGTARWLTGTFELHRQERRAQRAGRRQCSRRHRFGLHLVSRWRSWSSVSGSSSTSWPRTQFPCSSMVWEPSFKLSVQSICKACRKKWNRNYWKGGLVEKTMLVKIDWFPSPVVHTWGNSNFCTDFSDSYVADCYEERKKSLHEKKWNWKNATALELME